MAKISLKGTEVNTSGDIPQQGAQVPEFNLVNKDLESINLENFAGKKKILNIYPSVDTPTCAQSVRSFTEKAASKGDCVILHISADLPFAGKRFCAAEGIEQAYTLSTFRGNFSKDYNLEIIDGVLTGLCSRVVLVLSEDNKVLHAEQVSAIENEPDYEKALQALS
jgi:thiol peroxidase